MADFSQLEAGPFVQCSVADFSSDMGPDGFMAQHLSESCCVDGREVSGGGVGGTFVCAVHDDGSLRERKAWVSAQGDEPLFVVFCVFDADRKWRKLDGVAMHAGR